MVMNLQQLRMIKNSGSSAKLEHMKEVILKNSSSDEVYSNIDHLDVFPSSIKEQVAKGAPKSKFKKFIINHLSHYVIEYWYNEIINRPHR